MPLLQASAPSAFSKCARQTYPVETQEDPVRKQIEASAQVHIMETSVELQAGDEAALTIDDDFIDDDQQ
jgi:hypothetical protein